MIYNEVLFRSDLHHDEFGVALWEFEGEKPVRGKNRVVLREVFLALRHRVSGGAGPWKAHRYFKADMEYLNQ